MIIKAFDNATEEVLKPSNIARKIDGFPENVIVTFNSRMLNIMLKNNDYEVISSKIGSII